ncbi:hypothetical protein N5923_12275 [Erwiniaceae bacterium BAC15a-03b]|uniref:Type II secretion system (T2SS) protein M subtype b n=1 Tax=Winslowiella arboricola TaxID=2978220 RepID=A0A9J6PU37_9GAMM|nr:hypothetical protein [Winslowiella arboricola]MCU5772718.1 hypothetical protein [Winslowiella arboricola]MCU5778268.1 hypothetical protein [Winslowiella arboricola]
MHLNSGILSSLNEWQPRLRWYASQCYELLGPLPLLIAALWLTLLFYLCAQLRPALVADSQRQQAIHQQLAVPLPIISPEQETAESALSVTEYEQVKALFAILKKHGLQARESRYQQLTDSSSAQRVQLMLDIPLVGEYMNLQNALREMTASLPLQFESLAMARTTPATTQLSMSLRVTLAGEAP